MEFDQTKWDTMPSKAFHCTSTLSLTVVCADKSKTCLLSKLALFLQISGDFG